LILTPERWENIDGSSYLITGSAFDTDSVTKVEIRIDNGEWVTAYGTETWSYEWKTTPGKHTIYTRSFDGTGYSTISSVEVDVVAGEKGGEWYSLNIILLLIAGFSSLVMIAIIKHRRKHRLEH
jgi:hypothetical protein